MSKINEINTQIINLLRSTKRKGIENLISYLIKSDFFTAPASTKFHNCYEGGLAKHSLNVYYHFYAKCNQYKIEIAKKSIIISSILHDICKIKCYTLLEEQPTYAQIKYIAKLTGKETIKITDLAKNKNHASEIIETLIKNKDAEIPEAKNMYRYNDTFPIGHGEKSVIMLQKFIELTEQEIMLIRYHMNIFNDEMRDINNVMKLCPECVLLFTADYEVSTFI